MKKLKWIGVTMMVVGVSACNPYKVQDDKIKRLEKDIVALEMKIDSLEKQNAGTIEALSEWVAKNAANKSLAHKGLNEDHRRFLDELSKNQDIEFSDPQIRYLNELEAAEKQNNPKQDQPKLVNPHPNNLDYSHPTEVDKIKPLLTPKALNESKTMIAAPLLAVI